MQAMSYKIKIGEEEIPELSVFIEKYNNKETFFLFINRKGNVFRLAVDDGKKRLKEVVKGTEKRFDINSDAFTIFDMIDSYVNMNNDKEVLLKKYL